MTNTERTRAKGQLPLPRPRKPKAPAKKVYLCACGRPEIRNGLCDLHHPDV